MARKFTSTDAKYILTRHLAINKNRPYRPTAAEIRYWWAIIDAVLFNNALNKRLLNIYIHTTRCEWAHIVHTKYDNDLHYYNFSLTIAKKCRCFRHFITILVHEMVHGWEFITRGESDHGDGFMEWKHDVLHRVGVDLTEYIK